VTLHLCVLACFVLLAALVLWWKVWVTGHPAGTITCQCGDSSQELWFLAWTPYAILHGHNPFFTDAIFAGRGGANMIANTSWMFPSIVLAPITWLFGPVASFNVGAVLGPAVSAWSFFLAARKISGFLPGQLLGALLYGFSPFVIWNDPIGHLDFTLLFFAPFALVLIYDLTVMHVHRPHRVGLVFGLLVVIQFFTSTEFLAMCAVVGAVGALAAIAMAPRSAWDQRRRICSALGAAAAVAAAALAYPIWFLFEGPRHIVGAPWPNSPALGATAWAIVDAGRNVHAPAFFEEIGGYFGGGGPNFGSSAFPSLIYLGIPLLLLIAVSAVTWARSRLAWALVVAGVAAWVISFGTMLGTEFDPVSMQVHPWWLPWRILAHIPLISQAAPLRFAALVTFAAAMLLTLSLDRWHEVLVDLLLRHPRGNRHRDEHSNSAQVREPQAGAADVPGRTNAHLSRLRIGIGTGVAILGAASVAPIALTYSVPFVVRPTPVPAWFEVAAPRLSPSTVVLSIPFGDQEAMGWQAETDFSVRLAGGFAVVPGKSGHSQFVDPPGGAVSALERLSPGTDAIATGPMPASEAEVRAVREAIGRWRVGVVVVTPEARDPAYATAFMTAVMGRIPVARDGSWTWTGIGGAQPLRIGPTTLSQCAGAVTTHVDPETAASCVLTLEGQPNP
jgi:hypothetical protein